MDKDITDEFNKVDTSDFPDFDNYKTVLERGLWVLWVAKEKLGIKVLSAKQIASIVRDVKEVSVTERSIANAFGKAGNKIHVYKRKYDTSLFQIMKSGKDFLRSKLSEEQVEIFYFEPGNCYSSKRILSNDLLGKIEGDLGIVDPYCGTRTLDVLKGVEGKKIRIITQLNKLRALQKSSFLRELADFKTEYNHVEFRDYPLNDIHDRYVVSSDSLVILGHSIKDLGSKETFAIVLNEKTAKDIVGELKNNFNERWNNSVPI